MLIDLFPKIYALILLYMSFCLNESYVLTYLKINFKLFLYIVCKDNVVCGKMGIGDGYSLGALKSTCHEGVVICDLMTKSVVKVNDTARREWTD